MDTTLCGHGVYMWERDNKGAACGFRTEEGAMVWNTPCEVTNVSESVPFVVGNIGTMRSKEEGMTAEGRPRQVRNDEHDSTKICSIPKAQRL